MSMLEWLANEYMRFGCALEFVTSLTNRSVLHGVWRNRRDTLFFFWRRTTILLLNRKDTSLPAWYECFWWGFRCLWWWIWLAINRIVTIAGSERWSTTELEPACVDYWDHAENNRKLNEKTFFLNQKLHVLLNWFKKVDHENYPVLNLRLNMGKYTTQRLSFFCKKTGSDVL